MYEFDGFDWDYDKRKHIMAKTKEHSAALRAEKETILAREAKEGKLTPVRKAEIDAFFAEEEAIECSLEGAKYAFRGARVGRPRKAETQDVLTIRLPASKIVKLKATGKGWSTRVARYIENGIDAGLL
jgi:uncharacterized protein (DUF4415 family)